MQISRPNPGKCRARRPRGARTARARLRRLCPRTRRVERNLGGRVHHAADLGEPGALAAYRAGACRANGSKSTACAALEFLRAVADLCEAMANGRRRSRACRADPFGGRAFPASLRTAALSGQQFGTALPG